MSSLPRAGSERAAPPTECPPHLYADTASKACRSATATPVEQDRAELVALLDTVIGTAPVGITVFDLALRFVRINEIACLVNGILAEPYLALHAELM